MSRAAGRRGFACRRLGSLAAALLLMACGGASSEQDPSRTSNRASSKGPISMTLYTVDGTVLDLSELRGKPTLLFLFATFDGVSQASLRPLGRFMRDHPNVNVVGIAVQPRADELAKHWAHALKPPFVVGHAPNVDIAEGRSPLGEVERIPGFILLDPKGKPVARHTGFASERTLQHMLWRTLGVRRSNAKRAGQPDREPLFGEPLPEDFEARPGDRDAGTPDGGVPDGGRPEGIVIEPE